MQSVLEQWTLRFGPGEYVCTAILAMALVVATAPEPILKSWCMAVLGLAAGCLWARVDADNDGILPGWMYALADQWDADSAIYAPGLLMLFGFLLPRFAQYLSDAADKRFVSLWHLAHNALFFAAAVPALAVMRQPYLPARWINPLILIVIGMLSWVWGADMVYLPAYVLVAAMGLVFLRNGYSCAALAAGLATSNLLEENFRRSLLLSRGEWGIFLQRPLSATLLGVAIALTVISIFLRYRFKRIQTRQKIAPTLPCHLPGSIGPLESGRPRYSPTPP